MTWYPIKGGKPEEEKTVTAGTAAVVVNPSSGKTMKKVTVNPTPSQTKTVTAGTDNVTVSPDSGKLLSKVTVAPTPTQSKSITPSTSQQTVTPDAGKHLSSVVVGAVEDVTPEVTTQTGLIESIKTQLVGKATGANATADKILEGFSAWVNGQLVQGTAKEGIPINSFGYTKFSVDTFTPTTTIANLTVSHSLGEIPKIAVLWGKNVQYQFINNGAGTPLKYRLGIIDSSKKCYESVIRVASGNVDTADYCKNCFRPAKDTIYFAGSLKDSISNAAYFVAGIEYTLITLA